MAAIKAETLNISFPMLLVYDTENFKVGCALLQPLLGGTITGGQLTMLFDNEAWEIDRASSLKAYKVNTAEDLDFIADMTNKHHRKKN